ncbi:MAG: hypothetical protein LQ340_003877 [Diploschistes diacapsis]|nr:MAG: hypothetical protein LQ340_003877 [Diploschistes diacapsis]
MAFEQNYGIDRKFTSYDNVYTNFELSSSPFLASSTIPSNRRDSIVSSNSFLGSDSSVLTVGPMTPINHGHQGMYMEGLGAGPSVTGMSYSDVSAFMGINSLEALDQEDINMALQEPVDNKLSQLSWDTGSLSITNDMMLDIQLHHQGPDYSRVPPSTPQYNTSAPSTNANFETNSPHSTSCSSSFLAASVLPRTTVSPDQVYPLAPSPSSLGAPFTTPTKEERSNKRTASIAHRQRKQDLVFEDLDDKDRDDLIWPAVVNNPGDALRLARSPIQLPPSNQLPQAKKRAKDASSPPPPPPPTSALPVNRKPRRTRCKRTPSSSPPRNAAKGPRITNVGPAKFFCELCPSKFRRLEHRKRHFLSKHKDAIFPCIFCNELARTRPNCPLRIFNRNDNLNQHITKVHMKWAERARAERLQDQDGNFDEAKIRELGWWDIYQNMIKLRLTKGESAIGQGLVLRQKLKSQGIGAGSKGG